MQDQEYVIILPKRIDDPNKILMVVKDKPVSLLNCLSLVGGKVEYGETLFSAGARELKEESGLVPLERMNIFGIVKGCNFIIYCMFCKVDNYLLSPRPEETEKVDWYDWETIKNDKRLIPNLKIIIPLMNMGIRDWQLIPDTFNVFEDKYKIEFIV